MEASTIFSWVIVPLLIFCGRIIDVSLGTLRIIFLAKGEKLIVPVLGFFEILIWLVAMSQIMQNLTNVFYYLAYAGGFAAGNFVGLIIEEKLAMGKLIFRIILRSDDIRLAEALRGQKFRVTITDGEDANGPVKVLFVISSRADKSHVLSMIDKYNPHSFYTIDEVRTVHDEEFPMKRTRFQLNYYRLLFKRRRKEK
ncbi:DUF2179 domain-containing protein [candidate division KSB1 bacterium]